MRVQVDDIKLFFDVEGAKLVPEGRTMREKPTLLLLHGGPGLDHSTFKPRFSALADVAQIVYLDHRGNGRSDRGPVDKWNLAQWGDDVRAFCDAVGIERPIVLGHSFGGSVAMAYATRHPEHPAKLILTSTSAEQRLERVLAAFERLGGAEAREAARLYWDNPGPDTLHEFMRVAVPINQHSPRDPDAQARTVLNLDLMFHFAAGEKRRFNLLPALSRIHCPTLVLAGEDDPSTPIEGAEDIVAAIPPPWARLERFPHCGHGVFRDAPERALSLIREFVVS
jgi:pimeloyl-ACP methyl ester carboxylesterase